MSCAAAVAGTGPRESAAASRRARRRSSVSTDLVDAALSGRIAAFVEDAITPIAAAMARGDGPSPKRIVDAAGEAGLAGILTPETYGGAGGTHADFIDFI